MPRPSKSPENRRWGAGFAVVAVLGLLFLPVLPFLPLLFAMVEHFAFGTRYVENACEAVGIHGMLGRLYEPIIEFVSNLLG